MLTATATLLLANAARAQSPAYGTTTTTTATTDGTTPKTYIWNDPKEWWGETVTWETDIKNKPLFNANELNVDLFGTFLASERRFKSFPNTNIRHGHWGGGVGMNYFFTRDLGIGADTSFQTGASDFVDHVGGNIIARIPIEVLRTAPYVFAGGGRKFDPIDQWFGDVGAGLEFRFNRNLGVFGDARYIWLDKILANGTRDQALLRAGVRVAF
ncbi:MAG: hypothetical protein JWR19_2123 [Pedosphaera sp.]|nr:hypothetical protein [Pedosphaera sp.]